MSLTAGLKTSSASLITALAAFVLFGIGLRVFALDHQGYWHDELYSVAHISGFDAYVLPTSDLDAYESPKPAGAWLEQIQEDRFWETLDRNLVHEGHPPLYQLGLKAWTSLFGRSIRAVRSFSLTPALLAIPLLYLVGLRFRGPKLAAAAASLIAVAPFHVYYSAEARNYAWSMLFSALALLAVLAVWRKRDVESSGWLGLWWLAVLGAGSSHYYAGLYCGVLLLVTLVLRRRSLAAAFKLGIPFLFFLPWLPVLEAQIDVHSAQHWTAGAPGLLEAGFGFIGGGLDQLSGVFHSATVVERVVAAGALMGGASLMVRDPPEDGATLDARWISLSVPIYFVAVLAVDLTTDHHTTLISRYLIAMLPMLLVICAWLATAESAVYGVLLVFLIMANSIGATATVTGDRAPKQMLREAAAYIGDRYDPGDTVLVTPSGPTLVGMALYLPPEVMVGAAPPDEALEAARRMEAEGGTAWLARQNLGAPDELKGNELGPLSDRATKFAAIDVIPIDGTSGKKR